MKDAILTNQEHEFQLPLAEAKVRVSIKLLGKDHHSAEQVRGLIKAHYGPVDNLLCMMSKLCNVTHKFLRGEISFPKVPRKEGN